MARGRKITVREGGVLHLYTYALLHNDCNDTWAGIEIQSKEGDISNQLIVYGKARMENVFGEERINQP